MNINKEYKTISKRFKVDWEANNIAEIKKVANTKNNAGLNLSFLTKKNSAAIKIMAIAKNM
jgi:hypothetical protein